MLVLTLLMLVIELHIYPTVNDLQFILPLSGHRLDFLNGTLVKIINKLCDRCERWNLSIKMNDNYQLCVMRVAVALCCLFRYLLHPLNSAPSSASDDDDDSISVVSNAESASAASQGDADVIIEGRGRVIFMLKQNHSVLATITLKQNDSNTF